MLAAMHRGLYPIIRMSVLLNYPVSKARRFYMRSNSMDYLQVDVTHPQLRAAGIPEATRDSVERGLRMCAVTSNVTRRISARR